MLFSFLLVHLCLHFVYCATKLRAKGIRPNHMERYPESQCFMSPKSGGVTYVAAPHSSQGDAFAKHG